MCKLLLDVFCLLAISVAVVASRGFFTWPAPTRTPLPCKSILLGLAIFACSHIVTQILGYGTLALVFFTGCLLVLPRSWSASILYSGNKPLTHFWRAIGSGIRMGVITIPVTQLLGLGIQGVLIHFLSAERLQTQALVRELQEGPINFHLLLCLGVLIPIVEELFFRGIVQTVLKNHIPRGYALLCASLIFTLAHVEPSLGGLIYLNMLFIFSLAAGFIYEKERNITAPITLHITFNLFQCVMLLHAKA